MINWIKNLFKRSPRDDSFFSQARREENYSGSIYLYTGNTSLRHQQAQAAALAYAAQASVGMNSISGALGSAHQLSTQGMAGQLSQFDRLNRFQEQYPITYDSLIYGTGFHRYYGNSPAETATPSIFIPDSVPIDRTPVHSLTWNNNEVFTSRAGRLDYISNLIDSGIITEDQVRECFSLPGEYTPYGDNYEEVEGFSSLGKNS